MQTYATRDDLWLHIDRGSGELAKSTDPIASTTENSDKIQQALEFATNLMNEYLGVYFKLPIVACGTDLSGNYIYPIGLVEICCDLARYNIYEDVSPENTVSRRRGEAIERLKRYTTGQTPLFCPNYTPVPLRINSFFTQVENRPDFNCDANNQKGCGCEI